MIEIDGSFGEGGGQILRTSLGLSLAIGKPFHIHSIRAGRSKPGLQSQHLAAVKAAAEVGHAEVTGAFIGSREISFSPCGVFPEDHSFTVGTAGSTGLVLQAALPALLTCSGPSTLTLEGGTHNPWAPPFDFIEKAFLPMVCRMGPMVKATIERHGFYPAGAGMIRVHIEPSAALQRIDVLERGRVKDKHVKVLISNLPMHIARREAEVLRRRLQIEKGCIEIETPQSAGPGNAVVVEVRSEQVTEVFSAFGRIGLPAEKLSEDLAREVGRYLNARVPVGKHLADQLMVPMALAGGGSFLTIPLTGHAITNIHVIKAFVEMDVSVAEKDHNQVLVRLGPDPSA